MPEVIELKAECTIELEDALKVFGKRHRTPIIPPVKKNAQKANEHVEEDKHDGADVHKSE